jgi:hypothetical protein
VLRTLREELSHARPLSQESDRAVDGLSLDLGVTDCLPFSSVTTAPMTSPKTLTLLRGQSSWASLSRWTISRRMVTPFTLVKSLLIRPLTGRTPGGRRPRPPA